MSAQIVEQRASSSDYPTVPATIPLRAGEVVRGARTLHNNAIPKPASAFRIVTSVPLG